MTSALHVVWLLVACAFAARLMVAGLAAGHAAASRHW